MTRFLARWFEGLLEVFLLLLLVLGFLAGVANGPTEIQVLDGVIGLIAAIVVSAIFFGPVLVLIQIKNHAGNIEDILKERNAMSLTKLKDQGGPELESFSAERDA